MARLVKETTRLDVKFIDASTNDVIMEVNNRNHSDVGDMFTDTYVSAMLSQKFGDNVPQQVIVLVTTTLKRVN